MSELIEAVEFNRTLDQLEPDQLTKCSEFRVHELAAHIGAGAAEILRNVAAFNSGGAEAVPETRELEEREAPFHSMTFSELKETIRTNSAEMMVEIEKALSADPAAVTPWVGRQMPIAAFVTHARSEYAIHRWDMVGDDDVSLRLLAQPELTAHAIMALGPVLVAKGVEGGGSGSVSLVVDGQPTVLVDQNGPRFDDEGATGSPAILCDAASRLLALWGRWPDNPGRMSSPGGLEPVKTLHALLAGY